MKNRFFKTNIDSEIPVLLLDKLNAIKFKSKKSRDLAIKLIAVVLHSIEDEDADPESYYKELRVSYIREYLTSFNFYEKYFIEHLQGQEGKENFEERIFQTDGIYCVGYYGKHYRINPKYIEGPTKEINIEFELDCLNDLFPNVVRHFNYSTSLIKINKTKEEITEKIDEQMVLSSAVTLIGVNAVYYNGGSQNFISFTSDETKLPTEIKLRNIYHKRINSEEIDNLLDLKNKEAGEKVFFLLKERDKKNKCKYDIIHLNEYQVKKNSQFLKRVNKKIEKAISGKWTPIISSSNGRFNHLLSNLDNFCIDFFAMDNEPLVCYDLKCSQPTILANLLLVNPKLRDSIRSSKYIKLVDFLSANEDVFFKEKENDWFERFLNSDIYQIAADEKGTTRVKAKSDMMYLFFTEPNAPSVLKKSLFPHFPEFITGLQTTKESFKKNHKSSKKSLPLFLQLVEAHIFVEIIYEELANARIPAIPKHDSILCPASRLPEVKVIVQGCFERIGLRGKMELDVKKMQEYNIFPEWYTGYNSSEELDEAINYDDLPE